MAECKVIQLAGGQGLGYIQENSSQEGGRPESLLVWRTDSGGDLYGFPGSKLKASIGDTPLSRGASVDPSKLMRKYFHLMFSSLFFAFLLILCEPLSAMDSDVDVWNRISIQKALIRQETVAANRDFWSTPEFGWISKYSGRPLQWGNLHADFFYPVGESSTVELVFVESDALLDDVIHSFTIEKGNGIHTLKYGSDEFAGARSTVMPDRSSGKDGREAGAHFLKEGEGHEDTVSFLDGDRTDYYSFRSRPASILFFREDAAVRLETSPDFLSGKHRYTISESESGLEKIRVTANPGAPRQRYAIRAFSGQLRKKKVVDQLLRDAAAKNGSSIFREAASALVEFAPADTLEYCRTLERNADESMHIACFYYLYPHGNNADRKRIDNMAPGLREISKKPSRLLTRPTEGGVDPVCCS